MKYTTYYEEQTIISQNYYNRMFSKLTEDLDINMVKKVVTRKIFFAGVQEIIPGVGSSPMPVYSICVNDMDDQRIYLEMKNIQNRIVYKSFVKITRQECEEIFSGNYEWMNNHKTQLIAEFYLQLMINGIRPKTIRESVKEMIPMKNKKDYIIFKKSIHNLSVSAEQFFEMDVPKTCYMGSGEIMVSYKKERTIPRAVAEILHLNIESDIHNELVFSL